LTFNSQQAGNCGSTPIDLIVVDNIVPIRDPDIGEVTSATGGRPRVWTDWTALQSDLKASTYDYTLPALLARDLLS
jgi:hypothetical protein